MKALLLDDAPEEALRACAAAGLEVVRVASPAEGRALLSTASFSLVDGRIARPLPLCEEIGERVEAFFARLGPQPVRDLHALVMREVERPLIERALSRAGGVRAAAAEALGIDRGTLSRRMRALGLAPDGHGDEG